MPVSMLTAARGRPHRVAILPFNNQRKVALVEEFWRVCEDFRYPEITAVSRALNISISAVKKWKYKQRFPRWDVAIDVIEWVKAGKPYEWRRPCETDMM